MIRNGHAGFGRGVSEKDRKAPRRGPTSADPTGEKARAVKARYRGVCRGCGAYTQPRNGKGDAYAYCKRCHPGRSSGAGRASECSMRCASGAPGTGGCRRPMTGRVRMHGGAGESAPVGWTPGEWPSASVVTKSSAGPGPRLHGQKVMRLDPVQRDREVDNCLAACRSGTHPGQLASPYSRSAVRAAKRRPGCRRGPHGRRVGV